jgi:hypothetical protein
MNVNRSVDELTKMMGRLSLDFDEGLQDAKVCAPSFGRPKAEIVAYSAHCNRFKITHDLFHRIERRFLECMKDRDYAVGRKLYICSSLADQPLGLAATTIDPDRNETSIDYLTVLPVCVPSPGKARQFPGVGTCLIRHIQRDALQEGRKRVVVDPAASAVGFYKKLGFRRDPDDDDDYEIHIYSEKERTIAIGRKVISRQLLFNHLE